MALFFSFIYTYIVMFIPLHCGSWLISMSPLLNFELIKDPGLGPSDFCKPSFQHGSWLMVVLLCSVAQSCPTICSPMGSNPPGSTVHGILQMRILEWVAISSSMGSCQPRHQTHVSCVSSIGKRVLYHFTTW